jgi:hypothetical protein
MKLRKQIKEALDKPWLYKDEEIEYLQMKLKSENKSRDVELWYRRTKQGFSNYDKPL